MPYIGTQPLTGQFKKLDAITVVNGQAAYTMQYNSSNYKPATANALLVSVNGVIQAAGDAYDIDGSTITFTENLVTGDVIDFIIALGDTGSAVTPVDGSVTTAKLATDAVTTAKIQDGAVDTAQIAANAVTSAKMFSGFANGIAEFDLYAVNGNVSRAGQGTTVLTTQFTRFTQDFEKIGTGITNTSGVFSFPSTGKYVVSAKFLTLAGAANGYFGVKIQTTTDNSTYTDRSVSYNCSAGTNNYVDAFTQLPFDVTDTGNDKVRFVFETAGSGDLLGTTTNIQSYVSFVKLADT